MQAVIVSHPGGPEALQIVDVPLPAPGPGQVRVRVEAAAVNPVDAATRAGQLHSGGLVTAWPVALGWDVAGKVDALGDGVEDLAPGDAVIGLRALLSAPGGTYAEHVVLDRDALALAPRGTPAVAAATLPLNGLTALQTLDLLGLGAGQTLLVTGAAGAVGGFVTELGALRGLRVVAVAGPRDEQLVRSLGAEIFIPRGEPLGAAVRGVVPGGVDGAVDAAVIGVDAHEAVRDGGAFVAVVAGAAPLPLRGTRVQNVWIRSDRAQLAQLVELVETQRLTLRVADTLPLDHAVRAHERLEAGGLRGRLVLTA